MRAIRVTFDDGDTLETNINGTDEEIRAYYLGVRFNRGDGPNDRMATAVSVEFLDDPKRYIGRYARSVECGWLGKVVGVEEFNGDVMLRMHGVNELCRTIAGGDIEDWVEEDDTQWFAPEDLRFVKLV